MPAFISSFAVFLSKKKKTNIHVAYPVYAFTCMDWLSQSSSSFEITDMLLCAWLEIKRLIFSPRVALYYL
jgi:hypothetical protein